MRAAHSGYNGLRQRNMNTRPFGNTGSQASEIGLGCWQLGGTDWGTIDDQVAMGILDAAVDSGVNFLDTADVYGGGRSEELIGRFLKTRRGADLRRHQARTGCRDVPDGYTEAAVRAAAEASLRRLGG